MGLGELCISSALETLLSDSQVSFMARRIIFSESPVFSHTESLLLVMIIDNVNEKDGFCQAQSVA